MPRSHDFPDLTRMFYEPELDTLYERDFRDDCQRSRRRNPRRKRPWRQKLRCRRAREDWEDMETFIRHAHQRDRERQEELRADLTVDPEKKAAFDGLLPRIEAQMEEFRGRLVVKEGAVPSYIDVHLYVSRLFFDNVEDPNFLRDLGRTVELLVVEPHEDGFHVQLGFPYYNFGD